MLGSRWANFLEISLLKGMLARWFLDISFLVIFLTAMISDADGVRVGAQIGHGPQTGSNRAQNMANILGDYFFLVF